MGRYYFPHYIILNRYIGFSAALGNLEPNVNSYCLRILYWQNPTWCWTSVPIIPRVNTLGKADFHFTTIHCSHTIISSSMVEGGYHTI